MQPSECCSAPQVTLGKVHWIAPTGILGLTPIAGLGPVEVGPSPLEISSAVLPEVQVRLDPLQSLIHRKLMLQLQADSSQVGRRRSQPLPVEGETVSLA